MRIKITKMNGGQAENSRIMSLPKPQRELDAFFMDMGIGKENNWGYKISDIKASESVENKALEFVINEIIENYQDIDELNYIAKFSEKLTNDEKEHLSTVISARQPQSGKELINLMHNSKNHIIYDNTADFSELGKKVIARIVNVDTDSPLLTHINYKLYGQSYKDSVGGFFHDGKFIEPSYTEHYKGVMLPDSDKSGDCMAVIKITTPEKMPPDADFDSNNFEYIYAELPTTNYSLERMAHFRLGAESLSECIICDCNSIKTTLNEFIEPDSSIIEVNALMEVMSTMNADEFQKFEAVCYF